MSSNSDSEDDCYGPALPPHLVNKAPELPAVIGPQIPSHIKRTDLEILADAAAQRDRPVPDNNSQMHKEELPEGQSRPEEGDREEDDDGADIGPYLPDDPRNQMRPKARLASLKETVPTKREEWMLICPQNRSLAVGMGPRQFLARTPDDLVFDKEVKDANAEEDEDDADTFLETARAELANKSEHERDQTMESLMQAAAADKKESLLSLHRKRKMLEDAANKSSEPKERRPFDRDTDLKVGGLSAEDKAKFIKRSTELGTRFAGGKKKFL